MESFPSLMEREYSFQIKIKYKLVIGVSNLEILLYSLLFTQFRWNDENQNY